MSDAERKDTFDNEKASTHEVDLVGDPDAGLSVEERAAHVGTLVVYTIELLANPHKGQEAYEEA